MATRQRYVFCANPDCGAELLAPEQRLGGGIQLVPLALELAEPDVHVRRSAHGSATLLARELQRLLVDTRGIAETTLRDAYICQCDGAADGSREVPAPLHIRHTLGVGSVRGLQIATRPGRQAHECRCPASGEAVILGCEVEHPAGVVHGLDQIAASQCITRAMQGDRPWQRAEVRLRSRRPFRRLCVSAGRLGVSHRSASRRRWSTPSSSPLDSSIPAYALLSTGRQLEQFVGKRIEPAAQLDLLLGASQRRPLELDQVSRVPEVTG